MRRKLSKGEVRILAEFFYTIAAGWFSGGIIAPFFSKVTLEEKLLYFLIGFILAYLFLVISLSFAKEVKSD